VRSGDSGLDSPEVHRPRGWIIGPRWGVDKGDEFVMQLGRELLRLDSYMAPPRKDPSQSPRGPRFSAYVVPPLKEANQRLASPRKESDHIC